MESGYHQARGQVQSLGSVLSALDRENPHTGPPRHPGSLLEPLMPHCGKSKLPSVRAVFDVSHAPDPNKYNNLAAIYQSTDTVDSRFTDLFLSSPADDDQAGHSDPGLQEADPIQSGHASMASSATPVQLQALRGALAKAPLALKHKELNEDTFPVIDRLIHHIIHHDTTTLSPWIDEHVPGTGDLFQGEPYSTVGVMSKDQKASFKRILQETYRAIRAGRTPEQWIAARKQQRVRYAARTPEERLRDIERRRARQAAMTPEQKQAFKDANDRARRKRALKIASSPTARERQRERQIDYDKERRRRLTPAQRLDMKEKQRARKAALAPEQKRAELKRRKAQRAAWTPEQRLAASEKQRARRVAKILEQEEAELKRRKAQRAAMTPEQRLAVNEPRRASRAARP
ncbi:hypothetical protein FNAPI_13326 [Fusarium napiforme]|uniref:Uncharacterized protein n=1 Tax=Fusarium napiforme TaxID=42672 RepID=A0A8H5MID8_9HYPO|nr:hypothetical protein FNAPI_13326 [Fusarium napiforme]